MIELLTKLDDNYGHPVMLTLKTGEKFVAVPDGWREVDDGLAYAVRVENTMGNRVAGMGYIFREKNIQTVEPIQQTLTA